MKMPKFLLFCFLLVSLNATSQDFTLGIKGGLNFTSIGDLNSLGATLEGTPPDQLFTSNNKLGTTFGGYAMVNFDKILLRPEINYSQFKSFYELPLRNSTWTMIRLDVPLLLGYEIYKPVAIYAGPILSSTRSMDLEGTEFPLEIDKRDLSYTVGILIDFGQFGFDLRYEFDPTEETEQRINLVRSEYGTNVAELKPYNFNVLTLTAHINLFRTDNERAGSFLKGLFRGNDCYCPY